MAVETMFSRFLSPDEVSRQSKHVDQKCCSKIVKQQLLITHHHLTSPTPSASRILLAMSAMPMGFITKARIPSSGAISLLIRSLKPVQRMTGIPGRIRMISAASLSPVMWGMVMSVINKSKS
jgi:hypothetical protein